ncbi:cation:proton antiporter [Actinomycetaceae bacterium TAE3-ERU4]|nr:cation:proton antiporter [Actinomycetaceae bacterium TAE3-ERU4]
MSPALFLSLLAITAIATIAPIVSYLVPKNFLPESVLLVAGGVLIGPAFLDLVHMGHEIELLRELGLGFLFLLAGYEVDIQSLRGKSGRLASAAWLTSAITALAVITIFPGLNPFSGQGIAFALAMTATALGALIPILRDRNMLETKVGKSIITHGAIGELYPILAMAILLGVRGTATNFIIVVIFLILATTIGLIPNHVQNAGKKLANIIHFGSESTAQTTVRVTILLLVGLITIATVFKLDIVLGAFAAGFIVRQATPLGRRELEAKLDGIGYGFFIPIFFITTGAKLDLKGITENPKMAIIFVGLLMIVRGLPVFITTFFELDSKPFTRIRQAIRIAIYSSTSLPMIVAVTQVAVDSKLMEPEIASTLVIGGAASVLIMPLLGALLDGKKDREKDDNTKIRSAQQKTHEAREAVQSTRKLIKEAAIAQMEASKVNPDSLDETTRETALSQRHQLAKAMEQAQKATENLADRAHEMFPDSNWDELAQRVHADRAAIVKQIELHLHQIDEENEETTSNPHT